MITYWLLRLFCYKNKVKNKVFFEGTTFYQYVIPILMIYASKPHNFFHKNCYF
jgi:hypothetical protein